MHEEATRDTPAIAPAPDEALTHARPPAADPANGGAPTPGAARPSRLPRLKRPPRALAALMGAAFLLAVAWALVIPPFHAPDEDEHYVYSQSLAENLSLPPSHSWTTRGPQLSPAVRTAEQYARTRLFWKPQGSAVRPPWDSFAVREYTAALHRLSSAQLSHVDSAANQGGDPPLYHAWEAVAYRLTPSSSPFSRLFVMRLWSALLILLTVAGAWLLAGEVLGRDRTLQLLAAGCVGLQPMITFMSSGVNPDAGAYAASAFVLWLGVRVIRRGPSRENVVGLLAALAVMGLMKVSTLTMAPAVGLALFIAARRAHVRLSGGWRRWLAGAAGLAIAAGLVLATTRHSLKYVLRPSQTGGFLSYLWQYYLPRLPSQKPVPQLPAHAFYSIWFKGAWAEFGWRELAFPAAVYKVLAGVSAATFLGAGLALIRRRLRIDRAVVGFLAAAAVGLVLGLHVAEYYAEHRWGGPINEGRYLLALLPIAGLAVAVAVMNLARRRRSLATAVVLGAMLVLNLFSLGLAAGAFYA
ncbi:MAG: DUF2142 domain-containing protein [Actinobacteria bacterium]|nr:MAG: DUF2142 domain-containing protein [Actinomycetota bacterium]